ncbi:MAG: helix-turn-helix domain-containing protein [Clostridia bacterium]|jgi:AraC family 4-hydroxyphenylacetate 3-monooxygenase operon regulatory protein
MKGQIHLNGEKLDAMLGNYLKFDVSINLLVLNVYLFIDQFIDDKLDMSNNVRHNHSNFELQFFREGNAVLEVGNNLLPVSQNSLLLIAPGEYHHQKLSEKYALKYCLRFDYIITDRSVSVNNVPWCAKIIKILTESPFLHIDNCFILLDYLNQIKSELQKKELLYIERVHILLTDLFINIFRLIIDKLHGQQLTDQDVERDDLVLDLFFEELYSLPTLTAEDMAKHIGISVRHLNRILKKNYNLTFRQKLIATRIEISKGLLMSTDLSIEKISEKTGFSTSEYFYKCFKRITGMTPGEYRNKSRKETDRNKS